MFNFVLIYSCFNSLFILKHVAEKQNNKLILSITMELLLCELFIEHYDHNELFIEHYDHNELFIEHYDHNDSSRTILAHLYLFTFVYGYADISLFVFIHICICSQIKLTCYQ